MATTPSKTADDDALTYEETHVHSVYESIASHFSSTRYKPWPVVDAFLRELPPGSIGLDVGCGNGKYLNVNKDVFIVGSDRSSNLIALAAQHQTSQPQFNGTIPNRSNYNADVLIADTLSLPHPNHTFDFAICIAVIHHLSSRQRRIAAIRGILKTLKLNPTLNQLDQSHPPSSGQPETTPAHHASLATPSPAAHTQSQIENQVRGPAPKPKLGSAPAPKPKPGSAPAAAAVPAETTNRSSASATDQPPRSSATAAAVPDPSFPGSGDASASANTNTNTIADLRTQSPSSAVLGSVRDPVERPQRQQDFADPAVSVLQQKQPAGLVNEDALYADDVEGSEGIPCADAVGDAGAGLGPGGRESQAGRNGRDGLVVEGQRGAGSNLRPLSSARGSAGGDGDGYGYADGNGGSSSGGNGGNGGGVGGDVSDRVVASSSASLSLQQQQKDQGQASSSTSGMTRRSGGGVDGCTKVGQALLFVWALEQQGSRRGWKEGDEQDVLVPWVLKARGMHSKEKTEKEKKHKQKQKQKQQQQKTTTQNELPVGHTQVETQTQGEGEGEGAEENRAERNPGGEERDVEVVENEDEDNRDEKDEKQHKVKEDDDDDGEKVFGRFYHLYAHHELESECEAAGAVVMRSGYDRDNWWVVVEPASEPGPTRGPAPGLED